MTSLPLARNTTKLSNKEEQPHMDTTFTVVFGIIAMLLPLVVGRLVWKRFDQYFGRNDEAYMDTLEYFLKKIGFTVLIAFIVLWIGISLVFNGSPNY
jgi:hypothetical protein